MDTYGKIIEPGRSSKMLFILGVLTNQSATFRPPTSCIAKYVLKKCREKTRENIAQSQPAFKSAMLSPKEAKTNCYCIYNDDMI